MLIKGTMHYDAATHAGQKTYIKDLFSGLFVGQITEDAPAEAAQDSLIKILWPVGRSQHHHLQQQ